MDAALKNYDVFPGGNHLQTLRQAFDQWKAEKYVVCVDTSDVVNFMLDDMGTENWMDGVEKLTRRMQPIVQISRKLIADPASKSSTCRR